MIVTILVWYVSLLLVGIAVLPLTTRLFRNLPDLGVALSRPLGLVLCGFAYWLLVTVGLLHNSRAAAFFIVFAIGAATWLLWLKDRKEIKTTWRAIRSHMVLHEALLFVVFLLIALFVAYRPDIAATEKPMEFAFINAILRSDSFPPADPWLAGYGISYYYFGYIIAAFVTLLSGITSSVAYNLVAVTVFACAFQGAFSLVRNMVLTRHPERQPGGVGAGLLGGFLTLFMGNLEGLFEVIRSRGWGSAALFEWLDVRNLTFTGVPGSWVPADMWWWWRASRVLHDRNALGQSVEVIDEFPFFSLVLGDIHPHVLALPFVMLALGLALNALLLPLRQAEGDVSQRGIGSILKELFSGQSTGWKGDPWLWGLMLGAFGFLNTWDLPIYLGLFLVALGVREAWQATDWRNWLSRWLVQSAAIGTIAVMAYAPFYAAFRSQAGGFALVAVKTQPQQFVLMFGVFMVTLYGYVISLVVSAQSKAEQLALPGVVWAAMGLGIACMLVCIYFAWWSALMALGLAALSAIVLFTGVRRGSNHLDAPTTMALLLTIGGTLLVASVEFVMLRDSFGTRMNTVFKFYYAGWVLLACASAWGIYDLIDRLREHNWVGRVATASWLVLVVALVLAGGTYTIAATLSRANGFAGSSTLDGTAYVAEYRPDEQAVIDWFVQNAPRDAILVEAVGGSYTDYGWISAASGVPTLLGWTGHELQWRGSYDIPAERERVVELIYSSSDPVVVEETLAAYDVNYVVVGPRERATYGVSESALLRMEQSLTVVFESGDYVVFARS